jgi:hypothetical protein
MGVAGAPDRAAERAVPADVGDARRHHAARGRPDPSHRPRDRRRHVDAAPCPAGERVCLDARAGDPRAADRDWSGAGVRRALHPGFGPGTCAGTDQHQGRNPRGARRDRRGAGRLPVLLGIRQDAVAARPHGRRRAPRRHAAALPPPRRDAHAARSAQGRLRHRHAGCRHQRADPHRAVQRAVEVRRHPSAPAAGARVPADRGPRRPGGLRHHRTRRRRGAGARDRERPARPQGRRRPQEAQAHPAQEAAGGLRVVGSGHVREAVDRHPGAARLADEGQSRDGARRHLSPRRRPGVLGAAAARER